MSTRVLTEGEPADPGSPGPWLGVSGDVDELAARGTFARKYGRPPAVVRWAGAVWLAGPLEDPEPAMDP